MVAIICFVYPFALGFCVVIYFCCMQDNLQYWLNFPLYLDPLSVCTTKGVPYLYTISSCSHIAMYIESNLAIGAPYNHLWKQSVAITALVAPVSGWGGCSPTMESMAHIRNGPALLPAVASILACV